MKLAGGLVSNRFFGYDLCVGLQISHLHGFLIVKEKSRVWTFIRHCETSRRTALVSRCLTHSSWAGPSYAEWCAGPPLAALVLLLLLLPATLHKLLQHCTETGDRRQEARTSEPVREPLNRLRHLVRRSEVRGPVQKQIMLVLYE